MATAVNWSAVVSDAATLTADPDPKVRALAMAVTKLAAELTRQKVQGA